MKKQVIKYVQSLGKQAYYSGKQKTLFVTEKFKDTSKQSVEECTHKRK